MARNSEENGQRLIEVSNEVPSNDDIHDVQQDIRRWFERQDTALDSVSEYQLTAELHAIGQSAPWLIRAYADSTRIAQSKPINNVKAKRSAKDRFALYITIILAVVAACAFYPAPMTFLIGSPIAILFVWLLVREVLKE